MNKQEIEVPKTARYFTIGNEESPDEIWFVLHGYAQLANYFLEKFRALESKNFLVVAPEGLHRFYWNGMSGRVAASWMTKEDRLTDIKDYVRYLDSVYHAVVPGKSAKVRLLGFSQGTATACRWADQGNSCFDQLILWAGAFPDDIDYFERADLFNNLNMKVVIGTKDQYYTKEQIDAHLGGLKNKGIQFDLHLFDGDHNIYEAPLLEIL